MNEDYDLEQLSPVELIGDGVVDRWGVYGTDVDTNPPNIRKRWDWSPAGGRYSMEMTLLNEGELDVQHWRNELKRRMRLQHPPGVIMPDETWTKVSGARIETGWTPQETAKRIAPFYHDCRNRNEYGKLRVYPIEAWPWPESCRYGPLIEFFEALTTEGCAYEGIILDVNWWAVDQMGPQRRWWQRLGDTESQMVHQETMAQEYHNLVTHIRAWDKEVGIIIGSPFIPRYLRTEEGWLESAREALERHRAALGDFVPDWIICQSWFDVREGEDKPTGDGPILPRNKVEPSWPIMRQLIDEVRKAWPK